MKRKCINPNCGSGVPCTICKGAGEVDVIEEVRIQGDVYQAGNPYIDAALADPANPIKTAGQCCAHIPGHMCACVCGRGESLKSEKQS